MIQLSKQKIDFNDSNNIKPDGGSKHFTIFDLLTRSYIVFEFLAMQCGIGSVYF